METQETDLVIVGGGVAGLVMATEAFRRGFRARVLDREPSLAATQRAGLYQPRALDTLARLELYDPIRSAGEVIQRLALAQAGSREPQVVLDYAEAGPPFPHAIAAPHDSVKECCFDAFAKYTAIRVDQGVELLSLYRERGRVAGVLARGPSGDVTYRAKMVVVTTRDGGAPVRAEVGARARAHNYPEEHLSLFVPRTSDWQEPQLRAWFGKGAWISACPISADRLLIEAVVRGSALSGARARGAEAVRDLLVEIAPPLDATLSTITAIDQAVVTTPARSRASALVGDAIALIGPAARAMSPCGWNIESQAVLDASALAKVLSRSLFTGDFSALALAPYSAARAVPAGLVARLSDELHRLGIAHGGLYGRARRHLLSRLGILPEPRRKLIRTLSGFDDTPLGIGDRLRLGGFLPAGAP